MHSDQQSKICSNVLNELKKIYTESILPLERNFLCNGKYLNDRLFDAKPTIVVIGQRSSGKTSLIKYFLGREYPTTGSKGDKFTILSYENAKRNLNCSEVESFDNYLDKFEYVEVRSALLKNITIVDGPGIMEGKQETLKWLVKRVQFILCVLDSQNMDLTVINVLQSLKCHGDKIRIVLNKADGLDQVRLMEVYGKLMWTLGNVSNDKHMYKVYVGSFWNKPIRLSANKQFFQFEERRLFNDVYNLPTVTTRDVLECVIKRTNLIKMEAVTIKKVHDKINDGCGIEDIFKNLGDVFAEIQKEHHISADMLPEAETIKDRLRNTNIDNSTDLQSDVINPIDVILNGPIASVERMIPSENTKQIDDVGVRAEESMLIYLIVFLVIYVLAYKGF